MYSKNFYAVVVLIFFVFFTKLSAQSVVGTVSDSLSKNAINNALISLTGTNISTITNQNGEFLLRDIPVGEYLLEVNYFGYDSKKILVSVDSTSQIQSNIQLNPSTENDGVDLLNQSKSQLEEINSQLTSIGVKNVISGSRLQNLSDENLFLTLSRVPGVFINYKQMPFIHWQTKVGQGSTANENKISYMMPPEGYFPITEDPVWKLSIRGLGSEQLNVKLDGISLLSSNAIDKSIDLSLIAQENLQNIELLKTITSDEDGDASAGVLNLVRGKALGKRKISAQMLGNYNNIEKSYNQYRFVGAYSERFLDNKLGLKIDADIAKENNSSVYYGFYREKEYNTYTKSEREQGGANITIDYNTSDGGNLVFNGFYKKAKSNYFESSFNSLVFWEEPRYRTVEAEKDSKIFSLMGNNYLLGFDISWNASFSESIAENPLDYLFSFHYMKYQSPYHTQLPYLNYTFENPTKTYSNQKNIELNIANQFRYTNEISGKIKAGFKYKANVKNHDEDSRIENASLMGDNSYRLLDDGTKVKKDFSGTRFDGLIGSSRFDIYLNYFQDDTSFARETFENGSIPSINEDALRQWRELNINEYYLNNGLSINSYNHSGSISSAYLMHTLSFKNSIDFIAGIRLENENNEYVGYSIAKAYSNPLYFINTTPVKSETFSYTDLSILPNMQMLFKPSDFFSLRLAVYKTLIRPDYYQRAPKYLSCSHDRNGYLSIGNPNLENADVWNYEVQTQFFGKHIGVFSVNAFLKNIDGMIQYTDGLAISHLNQIEEIDSGLKQLARNFQFDHYDMTAFYTYYNSPHPAKIWGFEISHKMNMYFLPGYLKNIILDYNLTFLRSEKNIYKEIINYSAMETNKLISDDKEKLNVAPEFFANIILGYDIKGFSIRLAYMYQDNNKVVNDYLARPIIKNRYSRLDIVLRQQILDFISVKLLLNNITDANEEFTLGLSTCHKYSSGKSINFGIQVDL